MRRINVRIVGGAALIFVGVLFLLQHMGFLGSALGLLWGLVLAGGGLVFLYSFIMTREQWWLLIPGFALLGVAAVVLLEQMMPQVAGTFGGVLVLAMMGLSFLVVFLLNRDHWWALIPAGVLLTTAVMTTIPSDDDSVILGVLFLGMGLTFGTLAFLPAKRHRLRWAFAPAGVLLALGLLVVAFSDSILRFLWPVALILGGLAAIFGRNLVRSDPEQGQR